MSVVAAPRPRGFSRPALWAAVVALALLMQGALLWFLARAGGGGFLPRRLPVTSVSAERLDRIRKQWREKERAFLRSQEAPGAESEAPEEADYESDRDRKVARQQRAARAAPLPQAARRAQGGREGRQRLTRLSSLGVPIPLEGASASRKEGQGSEAADQEIADEKLPVGGENLLDTVESRFYSFFARFQEAVVPRWSRYVNEVSRTRALKPGDYLTEAVITLEEDGTLEDVEILRDSGIREFDLAVERALREAKQFRHPPRAMRQADGKVRFAFGFTVHVSEAKLFEFLPPRRLEGGY